MPHAAKRSPRRRLRRSAALRRTCSLLRATIESTADGLLIVDRWGRIAAYNRRFAEMWGIPWPLSPGAVDGDALSLVRGALRDPDAFLTRVQSLYRAPEAESFDVVELRDGRVFERYSQPQRIAGRCVGRVWSFRDVTDRRRAEAERARLLVEERTAREAAEHAVRARDEFFAAASHELKTPLTSLLLSVQHLLARRAAPADPARALAVLERQARRLSALVDVLLDVSRLSADPLDLQIEDVDLADVVRGVVADLRDDARAAGSPVDLRVEPLSGRWDRARVGQAIGCLLHNAIKYGAGQPVAIAVARDGADAVVSVRDAGRGVDPRSLARIFERFERASSAQHYAGLGLGLYFARRIVEAHGGAVLCESAPGEGATFTLRLPCKASPSAS